jgi:hypothetical protein
MLLKGARLEAPAAPLNDLLRIGLAAAPDEVAIVSARRCVMASSHRRAPT